ncbi:FAD:protein FMN transferase [Thermicanus aegyptius]|uniref:FAD:protein FMN transferase n=1 Tax=Thermicanus aegyptius TaxID=94009 RepID=UPI000405EA06|nr:FAD:protein FMN transferase [Thermicanus aegyptius]
MKRNEAIPFERVTFTAMNSEFLLLGEKRPEVGSALPWQREIRLWFAYVEKHCSRFLPDSEVSRLNAAPKGTPVLLTETCYRLLTEAWNYAIKTNFLFHPLVGRRLEEIGYDRSFDEMREFNASDSVVGSTEDPSSIRPSFSIGPSSLTFIPHMKAVIRRTDEKVDLGGIGKGWSVDRAAEWMMERGITAGLVDGGGDIRLWHKPGYRWRIGVEDPLDPDRERMLLFMEKGAVATSSKGYRCWKHEGKTVHHLLNGRTGCPANTGVLQATVIGETAAEAEVLAKVLCLFDPDEAKRWAEKNFPHLAYILFDQENRMIISNNLEKYAKKAVIWK